jgi:hypothetical protein
MIKMQNINVINIHIQVGLSMGGKMGMEFCMIRLKILNV